MQTQNQIQDEFSSNEYIDPDVKLPKIQALRGSSKKTCGYFVSLEQMLKAEWIDLDQVKKDLITYTYENSGEEQQGLIINNPRMLVCPKTPLLAYSRRESRVAKQKVIVGQYQRKYKENTDISVYQSYNILLLNENNQLLHKIPFEYSAKGVNQATFGTHWSTFVQEINNCHARANDIIPQAKNNKFNCLCLFSFKVERKIIGQEEKSATCYVAEHEQPTDDNWKNYFVGYDNELKKQIWEKLKPQEPLIIPGCSHAIVEAN